MQNEQNDDHYFDTIELENRVQFTGQAKLRNLLWEFIPYLTRENKGCDILHETYFANLNYKHNRKIATVHDLIPIDYPKWFNFRLSSMVNRNFKRQANTCSEIVFSSHFTKSRAIKHGFSETPA